LLATAIFHVLLLAVEDILIDKFWLVRLAFSDLAMCMAMRWI